jgi:RNA polymerase sigma factor (sigma-70 family)
MEPSPDVTTMHVRRALEGDAESLEWMVRRFSPLLRAQASYRLGSSLRRVVDVEDLVSEAWMVGLLRLPSFDVGDRRATPSVLAYMAQIIRNLANSALRAHLRRNAREVPMGNVAPGEPVREFSDEMTGLVTRACRRAAMEKVDAALQKLDEASRTVVILRGIEGLPNQEAAALLGELPNTVAKRYQRALQVLRARLGESVFDEFRDG